ncbi:MAG TPA: superoxide dismutase, Ni [Thermoplasmata archaeon]|nr:superoxide dismutase, Ni [Thermoplasmata archaeon]
MARTMSLAHLFLRALERAAPSALAFAHCDIPCGIYDPHHAQVAAHTVVRMDMLIAELKKQGPTATADQRQELEHKLARYTATKEQHAEIAKQEVRILWGDYFKPEHVQQHPELHDLVWKAMKAASKARQEIGIQTADDLLKTVNEIAKIFWKTKGLDSVSVKAPYPTERELIVPKLG